MTRRTSTDLGLDAHRHSGALVSLLALLLSILSTTSACGGCPRARGARVHVAHPAAADVILQDPIVIDGTGGAPSTTELDHAVVRAVVSSQLSDVARCVEAARAEHPALSGELDLDLGITAEGVVRVAELAANDTGDGVLAACLVGLAVHWHFPASAHGASVRVPFSVEVPPPPAQAETPAASDGEPTVE